MTASKKFVSAVKIAAQLVPVTSALAQWLNEIETAQIVDRLDRLEDPLTNHGPQAKQLSKLLYSLVQAQSQDLPATTHIDWTPGLKPFIKELRSFEAAGFVMGSHRIGAVDFTEGLRLSPAFIVYLAVLYDDRAKIARLIEMLDDAKEQLIGKEVRKSVDLPLTVIDAFFANYANRGQGYKSGLIGESIYIPKPPIP